VVIARYNSSCYLALLFFLIETVGYLYGHLEASMVGFDMDQQNCVYHTTQTTLLRALHLTHFKAEKKSEISIMVQDSLKYPKCSPIIKELLTTLACNFLKLKLKSVPSFAISHTRHSCPHLSTAFPIRRKLMINYANLHGRPRRLETP